MRSNIEPFFVHFSNAGFLGKFLVKAAPNNYQYPHETIRVCERDGVKYRLDISDYMQYCIYFRIDIEPRQKLYSLVKDGTTVIDVGTNIGETLLNFAKRNPTGLTIGFEPVPELYAKAIENERLNKFENVVVNNLALSDRAQSLHFNIANEFNSGGIFLSEPSGNNSVGIVRAVRLDDYLAANNVSNVSLIKIDVEGFEMKVLRGAISTLERFKPIMFVEVNDGFLRRQGACATALFEFLGSYGYQISYAETGEKVNSDQDFAGSHFDIVATPVK